MHGGPEHDRPCMSTAPSQAVLWRNAGGAHKEAQCRA
jgi:hypothetical protein